MKGHGAPKGEAPGFWGLYWHYLTNPSELDDDLETGFYVSGGVGVAAATGAAVVAAGGAVVAEVVDTAVEELASHALGGPVFVPLSPFDAVQDGTRLILKKAGREALEETGEAAAKFGGKGATEVAEETVHKNSNQYVGDVHVYRIVGPNGTHKIGESAQGVRKSDGASIRGEEQARKLRQQTGQPYRSEIIKEFADKRSARSYETDLIERFKSLFGDDALPGNKINR